MRNIILLLISLSSSLAFANQSLEKIDVNDPFRFRLYGGGAVGYGSTTWNGLVPAKENQNVAINISAPTLATEGGFVTGGFIGYELSPYFALEASYMRYPNATLEFDENSLFAFDHDDNTTLTTRTETVAAMAKIMLLIPKTYVRAYSSAGVANVHRTDDVSDQWHVAPTFGVGLNYNLTPHIMTEIAATYTAGYGESEINPVNDYIPFLYSVAFKLAYRM